MPATKTVWKVKFCDRCCHAFDVRFTGKRTSDFCDECRRERKAESQVRRNMEKAAA